MKNQTIDNEQLLYKSLKDISRWGRFLGWVMIIFGAISALAGLGVYVIGCIPGIITFLLGLFLKNSGDQASELLVQSNDENMVLLLQNYAKYLKLQGIYMIVTIVVAILYLLMIFYLIAALSGSFSQPFSVLFPFL